MQETIQRIIGVVIGLTAAALIMYMVFSGLQ